MEVDVLIKRSDVKCDWLLKVKWMCQYVANFLRNWSYDLSVFVLDVPVQGPLIFPTSYVS